jgi:hypothetical protein
MLLNLLLNPICVEFEVLLKDYCVQKPQTNKHPRTHTLKTIYIVTRSTNVITMNITNINKFLRVVTDVQPSSTAPLLTSMKDTSTTNTHRPITIQTTELQ